MAVTQDAVSPVLRLNGANSGTNVQVSMDVAADANYALIFIDSSLLISIDDGTIAFPTITLGGSSNFTQVASAKKHSGSDSDTHGFVDIYKLASPPTGAARTVSITMTYTGTGNCAQLIAWCETYKGVDVSGTPLGTAQVANGQFVSSLTLTDTLASGDYFSGICGNGSAAPGVTTGTSDASQTGTTGSAIDNARLAHNTGSGSTSIVFSTDSADYSAASGVKLLAPTGGNPPAGNAAITVTANNPTVTRSDPYVVSSIGAAVSNASPSVTFSGYTPLENDVIVMFVSSTTVLGAVANASLPAGWVNPLGDGVEINSDAHGMACFYHKVTATEQTNVTLTYTATSALDATETGYVQAVAVRNVDPNNVIDGFNTAQDSANTVTPHVLAGITGSGVLIDGSLVVSSVAKDGTGDYGASAPTGWTRLRNDNTNQGRWIGYRDTHTTVNTDVTATNITPSGGDEYASVTLALARVPSGTTVNVPAAAAVSVTANNASHDTRPTSGNAAVTVTANGPAISRQAIAGNAAVTVTANNTGAAVAPTPATGTVAVVGNDASHDIRPPVGNAAVAVTANNATPSTTTNVSVDAGNAAVTVTANQPTPSVAPSAGSATVAVAGNNATPSVAPSAGNAAVALVGNNPSHDIRPGSGYALVVVAANNAAIPGTAFYVTSVSANGHYLLDQNSDPIFVYGNSPQNMVANGTLADMASFFADQQARGFNSAQVHLVYNFQADAESTTNPFGTNGNLAPQNSGYWATIDSMFDTAETYGFTLWATVIDNISCGSTVESSVSTAEAFAYGQFLGARYASRPGLVWVIGNDFDSSQWTARNAKYEQILAGIRDQGDTHLATVWNNTQPGNANTDWDTLQDIDNGYAYDAAPWDQTGTSYALTRTGFPKPFVWFEGTYYGEKNASTTPPLSTDLELRKLAWWTITWGGVGHFFGTHEVWQFADWTSELTAGIYDQLQLIPSFITGLTDWELMVPDTGDDLLTGGKGTQTGTLDSSTYATAAYVPDGVTAVIYFPTSRGSITIDTTQLSGTVTGYWWDPYDGSTSTESTPAAPTHPGNNTGGDGDWVLVLQGTAAVTASAGNAPVTVTGNNASHSIAPTTGTATVAATANNPTISTTTNVNVDAGNAPVAVTANAPSISVKASAGVATVAVTANNATISTDSSRSVNAGVATVAVAANNTGASVKPTSGTATVAATANQPQLALTAGAGVASVTVAANAAAVSVAVTAAVATILATANQPFADNGVPAVTTFTRPYRTRRPGPVRMQRPGPNRYRHPGSPT